MGIVSEAIKYGTKEKGSLYRVVRSFRTARARLFRASQKRPSKIIGYKDVRIKRRAFLLGSEEPRTGRPKGTDYPAQ